MKKEEKKDAIIEAIKKFGETMDEKALNELKVAFEESTIYNEEEKGAMLRAVEAIKDALKKKLEN